NAPMTVSAVSPWRTALQRDTCFPVSVFGPVLLNALRRLALICLYEVIEGYRANWVRFAVLTRPQRKRLATDVSSATGREPRVSDRYHSYSTTRLHRRSDVPRGDVRGTEEP